ALKRALTLAVRRRNPLETGPPAPCTTPEFPKEFPKHSISLSAPHISKRASLKEFGSAGRTGRRTPRSKLPFRQSLKAGLAHRATTRNSARSGHRPAPARHP